MELPTSPDDKLDRIQELMSGFFDEALDETQFNELNEMLIEDAEARSCCIEFAQLHADLLTHFGGDKSAEADKSPLTVIEGLPEVGTLHTPANGVS